MDSPRVISGDSAPSSLLDTDDGLHPTEEIIEITDAAPHTVHLRRFLSTRSVLSTTSSFAIRQQEARDKPGTSEKIGEGFCAEIFNLPGAGRVIKRARRDPTKPAELWRDFGAHLRVYESLHDDDVAKGIDICVPKPCYFVTAEDFAEWATMHDVQLRGNRTGTPKVLREPSAILVSERIMPLPRVIREALIRTFCPEAARQDALDDVKNNDCLVRIYLGVRRPNPLYHPGDFSLRNFELTLDKMELIGIHPLQFATRMAEALAVMHWDAHLDAADVEFVLGSAPESRITARDFDDINKDGGMRTTWQNPRRLPQDNLNFSRRTVSMWLLDFNQVGRIRMRVAHLDKMAWAFWNNDPYYPRPGQELWDAFKSSYLARCDQIIERSSLPRDFIDMIEDEAKVRGLATTQGPPPKASSSKPPVAGDASASKSTARKAKKHRKYVSLS